jgi:hypothetical protein
VSLAAAVTQAQGTVTGVQVYRHGRTVDSDRDSDSAGVRAVTVPVARDSAPGHHYVPGPAGCPAARLCDRMIGRTPPGRPAASARDRPRGRQAGPGSGSESGPAGVKPQPELRLAVKRGVVMSSHGRLRPGPATARILMTRTRMPVISHIIRVSDDSDWQVIRDSAPGGQALTFCNKRRSQPVRHGRGAAAAAALRVSGHHGSAAIMTRMMPVSRAAAE